MTTESAAELGYRLLCVAEERFGRRPAQLDEGQRRESLRIARRHADIEAAVLTSGEAAAAVVPDAAVEDAFARIRARYGSAAEFQRELAAVGLDTTALRRALARELRAEAVLARVAAAQPAVDDTEARLYYYLHPEQFQREEARTARHILITINPDFPENRRDAAAQRMAEIARRLARKPERFAEQAQKHSECPTALQGGLLGEVKRGTLFPALDEALFALPEGGVSAVVESPLGFHLLWCEHISPAGPRPLAEVLPALREQLTERARRRRQRRWLEQLCNSTAEVAVDG